MAVEHKTKSPGAVRALAVSADGKQIFSAGADRNIRLWELSMDIGLILVRAFQGGHDGVVTSIALLDPSDPRHVVSGSEGRSGGVWAKGDGGIKVWRASDGKCLLTTTKQTGDITAFHVCVDPGASGAAGEQQDEAAGAIGGVMSASKDGTVVEWAVEWSQDAGGGGGSGGQGHTMQWKAGTLQGKRF